MIPGIIVEYCKPGTRSADDKIIFTGYSDYFRLAPNWQNKEIRIGTNFADMRMKLMFAFFLLSGIVSQVNGGNGVKTGTNIGDKAPEISAQSIDGKLVSLSSLKGKTVLIDFWASWCPPCRMENPNIVEAYRKYKDSQFQTGDGFTIFSISLDNNKKAWQKAILTDNLSWENHVSDLQGWDSAPASLYGVKSIPMNFLINADGIIVAKNLRGDRLDKTLGQLLEK